MLQLVAGSSLVLAGLSFGFLSVGPAGGPLGLEISAATAEHRIPTERASARPATLNPLANLDEVDPDEGPDGDPDDGGDVDET